MLEKVQRKFIRMLLAMENVCYEERLDTICFSLKQRISGHIIEVYKMRMNIDKIVCRLFPISEVDKTKFRIRCERFGGDLSKTISTKRVVSTWATLSKRVKEIELMIRREFKNCLNKLESPGTFKAMVQVLKDGIHSNGMSWSAWMWSAKWPVFMCMKEQYAGVGLN